MTANTSLTSDQADRIITAAFHKARELGLKPLTVAVLDPGGHLIALRRQDGSSTLRPQIAIAKASTALALGISSRKVGEMAAERPSFIAALGPISPNGIIPVAGGVLIKGAQDMPIGAVGITGDSSDNDERVALAALDAVDLATMG